MTYSSLKFVNELDGIQAKRTQDGVFEYFAPGSEKHKQAIAGDYGQIEEFTPSPITPLQVKQKGVREQRDRLLKECDWTQVADATVDQSAWATYRQALRDVPQQDGFPSDVLWPDPPTP